MTLKEQIQKDLRESLKEKNEIKNSVLKMFLSSVTNKEIETKKKEEGLNKEEEAQVIKSEMKKRRKSIEAFKKAKRSDLVNKEKKELTILESYGNSYELNQEVNPQNSLDKN